MSTTQNEPQKVGSPNEVRALAIEAFKEGAQAGLNPSDQVGTIFDTGSLVALTEIKEVLAAGGDVGRYIDVVCFITFAEATALDEEQGGLFPAESFLAVESTREAR